MLFRYKWESMRMDNTPCLSIAKQKIGVFLQYNNADVQNCNKKQEIMAEENKFTY